jgi:CRP-like cAMP-binding protein
MSSIPQKIADFFTPYPLRNFDKLQIMVRAEDNPPGVFYILEGRVSQYDITPSGNEVVVNVFKPGAFFPMSWAINETPNHYFFEASTKIVARVAPVADAVQFLKDNPDVAFDLLGRVYRGMDGVLRRMAHLMGGDAKSRLLFEILNATYRFGEQQKDGHISVALKESDLARHSGLARETVNRCIQDLKAVGAVSVTHKGMIVKDIQQIETMLGATL